MLGTHLAYNLLKKGESVTALRRSSTNLTVMKNIFSFYENGDNSLFEKIKWVDGDILDFFILDAIISKHKQVYHTAAFVSFHKQDHNKILDINIHGTENIVEACIKHNSRLVYSSSIAALGRNINGEPTTENDFRDSSFKSSVYSESKFIAEQEVWRGMAEGLDAVIVNPSIIIGAGDWNKSSAQLFKTVANGLKFYTNGSNGYIDVRDIAEVMNNLMNSTITAERYILSAENITYKRLFQTIAKELNVEIPKFVANKLLSEISWRTLGLLSFITGKTPLITKETAKSANSFYNYSSKKIIDTLNYNFISFDDSVKHTANVFLNMKK